jgi:hypothetical protein
MNSQNLNYLIPQSQASIKHKSYKMIKKNQVELLLFNGMSAMFMARAGLKPMNMIIHFKLNDIRMLIVQIKKD